MDAIEDDIVDNFAMQELKTDKGSPKPPTRPAERRDPGPVQEQQLDITVEEKPGEFGPDTIVEKINQFWNKP